MFCHKCNKDININSISNNVLDKKLPQIFTIMNYILNNLDTYNDIYTYLSHYKSKKLDFWTARNNSGITIFHLLVWYISIQTVKFKFFKQKILKIFIILFGFNYKNNLILSNDNDNDNDYIINNINQLEFNKYNNVIDTEGDNNIEDLDDNLYSLIFSNNHNYDYIIKFINNNCIFNKFIKNKILNLGTNCDKYHTIYHHMNQYCENKNDIYFKYMYKYLLNHNEYLMTKQLDNNNKTANDYLYEKPTYNNNIIMISNNITGSYKNIEKSIINYLDSKNDFKLTKCHKCKNIVDYSLDIPNIINYAFETFDYVLINLIIKSYQLRFILNNIYSSDNISNNKLSIDNRHKHIINIYKNNINNNINIDNYISIIE
jgi:hypothetical protein